MLSRALPPHGAGGLAAAAWDLAEGLVQAGAEVEVLTTRGGGAGTAVLPVRALDAPAGRYSAAWWRETRRAYAGSAPGADVVLGISAAANALVRRRSGGGVRPVFVFQAHGTSWGEVASKLRARRLRACAGIPRQLCWGLLRDRAYRRYDAVTAVGAAVAAQLAAAPTRHLLGATPVRLIPNGVEEAAFAFDAVARQRLRAGIGAPAGAPVLLSAGRLQADKGVMATLEVFRRVEAARPGARLVIAGEGPERARVLAELQRLGLQGRVTLLGSLPRMALAPWFSAADALVLPTRRAEGLPLVVLEALASGLAVVATAAGAADPELPCLRFRPDDLAGMAAAAAQAAPADRRSRLPRRFTRRASAEAHLDLFEELLRRRTA